MKGGGRIGKQRLYHFDHFGELRPKVGMLRIPSVSANWLLANLPARLWVKSTNATNAKENIFLKCPFLLLQVCLKDAVTTKTKSKPKKMP